MVFSEIVRLAIDSFSASKVRFALTALGMVIGSASLILVFTIGLTGKQYILSELEKIGTNMVDLGYSGGGSSSGNVSNNNDYLTHDDELAVEAQVPAVAYSSPLLQMHDKVSFGGGVVKDVLVLGVTPEYAKAMNSAGLDKLSPHDLVSLKAMGVTPEYIATLHRQDSKPLTAHEIISMKATGVTPEYAQWFRQQFPSATEGQMRTASIFHLDDKFLAQAKAHGFDEKNLDKLIRLKISGLLDD